MSELLNGIWGCLRQRLVGHGYGCRELVRLLWGDTECPRSLPFDLKLVSVKLAGFSLAWPTFSFGFYSHVSDDEPKKVKILVVYTP